MDWIKQNRFLSGYLAVLIVGVLGLGFWAFKGWGGFKEAKANWETQNNRLTSLERKSLYPNDANLGAKMGQVEDFSVATNALHGKLTSLQRKLKNMSEQDFRELMNGEAEAVAGVAADKGMVIPEDFYLGFEAYTQGKKINPKAIPLLELKLDAIKQFVNLAAESGVAELVSLERVEFPQEDRDWDPDAEEMETKGKPKKKTSSSRKKSAPSKSSGAASNPLATAGKVMDTYRFIAKVRGGYPSIQALLNRVAGDETFFLWIRDLRVENNVKTSPRHADIPPPAPVEDAMPDENGETGASSANRKWSDMIHITHELTLKECLFLFLALLAIGVVAYSYVFEQWPILDSLYFTVVLVRCNIAIECML